ncbi:MAG: hypothetical protein JWM98_2248 [Thermoleophilia bacterium]|nr:hypothetical protein [Thermoleophilia bacterium]
MSSSIAHFRRSQLAARRGAAASAEGSWGASMLDEGLIARLRAEHDRAARAAAEVREQNLRAAVGQRYASAA